MVENRIISNIEQITNYIQNKIYPLSRDIPAHIELMIEKIEKKKYNPRVGVVLKVRKLTDKGYVPLSKDEIKYTKGKLYKSLKTKIKDRIDRRENSLFEFEILLPGYMELKGDVWQTKEGKRCLISQLEDNHLINIIYFLQRRAKSTSDATDFIFTDPLPPEHGDIECTPPHWTEYLPDIYQNVVKEAKKRGLEFTEEEEEN